MAAARNTHTLERVPTIIVEGKAHDVVLQALANVTNDIVSSELVNRVLIDVQAQELNKEKAEEFDVQSEIYIKIEYAVAADSEFCDTRSLPDEDEVDDVVVDETESHITGRNSQQRKISIEILSREASLHYEQSESDEEEEEELELEEEEEEAIEHQETEQEFIIRRSFENYSNYTISSCRALEAYLTEKRFLQFLREAQLMGIGTQFNTTDAEMCYFRNVVNKRRGLFFKDFKAALEDIKDRLPEASIEEALAPLTDVHYQPKDMMGTGRYLLHDRLG